MATRVALSAVPATAPIVLKASTIKKAGSRHAYKLDRHCSPQKREGKRSDEAQAEVVQVVARARHVQGECQAEERDEAFKEDERPAREHVRVWLLECVRGVCVRVCVCVRERERESACECVCTLPVSTLY